MSVSLFTLWFLAKYGCCFDEIKFYNVNNVDYIWEESDIIITADMDVISAKPKNKRLVVINRIYNENVKSDKKINNLKEIDSFENL